jgi:hypothetical protein
MLLSLHYNSDYQQRYDIYVREILGNSHILKSVELQARY